MRGPVIGVVMLMFAGCSSTDDPVGQPTIPVSPANSATTTTATTEPDRSTNTVTPTTTQPVETVADWDPEPVIVLCNSSTFARQFYGAQSGRLWGEVPALAGRDVVDRDGQFDWVRINPSSDGFNDMICAKPTVGAPLFWNEDYTEIIAMQSTNIGNERERNVVEVRMDGGSVGVHQLLGPYEQPDFGSIDEAVPLAASYTPDRQGFIWREELGGKCITYMSPTVDVVLQDGSKDSLVIGRGGACNSHGKYAFYDNGGQLVMCRIAGRTDTERRNFDCADLDGNDIDDLFQDPPNATQGYMVRANNNTGEPTLGRQVGEEFEPLVVVDDGFVVIDVIDSSVLVD